MRSRMGWHRAGIGLGIAAVLALAACGGAVSPGTTQGAGQATAGAPGGPGATIGGPDATGNGDGSGGVPADVCALLTVDEVAGALATDPTLTAGPDPEYAQACAYALGTDDYALRVRVVTDKVDAAWTALGADGAREVVDGLGGGALYSTSDRELEIKVGGTIVRLWAVYAGDSETTLEHLKALAKIVIARLQGTAVPPDSQITAPPLVNATTACDLLSKDDVARVLEAGPIGVVDTTGAQLCSFTVEATGEYLVGVYLDRKGGLAAWQSIIGSGTTEHVDGLGNDAAYDAFSKRLAVQVGDQIVHVEVYSVADDKALATDRALMEIMLGNL